MLVPTSAEEALCGKSRTLIAWNSSAVISAYKYLEICFRLIIQQICFALLFRIYETFHFYANKCKWMKKRWKAEGTKKEEWIIKEWIFFGSPFLSHHIEVRLVILVEDDSFISAAFVLRQLVNAVKHIHSSGMMHRDLSAGNVLISSMRNGKFRVVCNL